MAETLISPGILARENDISFMAPLPREASAAFIGPTVKGPVEIPTIVTSYGQYQRIFGVTFTSGSTVQEFLTSLAVKSFFSQGGQSALITRVVSGSFTRATSTAVTSLLNTGSYTNPFLLETLGKGAIYNNSTGSADPGTSYSDGGLVSGSSDNLRWEVVNPNSNNGTFTLLIRRGDDNTKNKIILETFTNLSLDPNSENYIKKIIGDQYQSKTTDSDSNIYIDTVGEYPNHSNYVRVSAVNLPTLNYLGVDGITVNKDRSGNSYSGSLPTAQSGSFYGATGTLFRSTISGSFFEYINDNDTQGLTAACYDDAISILGNTDEYLFNIVLAPGLVHACGTHGTRLDNIVSLAETRGDAIAVVDMVRYGSSPTLVAEEAKEINSSYAATYWPWLQVGSSTGRNVWVPASVVIPGVYALNDRASAPWFAPAGLTRGGLSDVIQAERKVVSTMRDTLYNGNVNPIATFPGSGISVFGQKTLQKKASALDRVNVRRLLLELKKFIKDVARNLVFEQNTIATRNSFLATVNPYLESVMQRQGLYAFRVIMDETNNTSSVIDRNQLVGQIYLQPAKTVEFIILDFTITPTGATFAA